MDLRSLRLRTGRAFMENADVLPEFVIVEKLATAVLPERERIGIGDQGMGEFEVALDAVVGVPDKDVVGLIEGMLEGLGAVVAEIFPGIVEQLAGDPLGIEEGLDEGLGGIRGAGIAYHVVVELDVGPEIVKGLHDNVGLVLHNHIQTDCLLCRQFHCL
jgi:hypothetical protein